MKINSTEDALRIFRESAIQHGLSHKTAQPTNPVGRVYGCYPKTVAKRYMKNGMSLTPFTCARKHLTFEFSDSAEALV